MKKTQSLNNNFSPASRKAAAEFDQWFTGSKVVDDNGAPLRVFHATGHDFSFERFRPLSHFGSAKAAELIFQKRMAQDYMYGPIQNPSDYRTYPVYLNLKNPLEINDIGSDWNIYFYRALKARATALQIAEETLEKCFRDDENWVENMISLLSGQGYDGFVYKNEYEDRGSLSYVVFRSTQVCSVFDAGLLKRPHSYYIARDRIKSCQP